MEKSYAYDMKLSVSLFREQLGIIGTCLDINQHETSFNNTDVLILSKLWTNRRFNVSIIDNIRTATVHTNGGNYVDLNLI